MAGLSNRSRPVLGVGEYLLPLEFTLAPDVNLKYRNIVAPVVKKPFNLRTKLDNGNSEFVVPIIKSDFKLRTKANYVFRIPVSPVQRKPYILNTKVSNRTQEVVAPIMRSTFTLGTDLNVTPPSTSASFGAIPKEFSLDSVFPRKHLRAFDFNGSISVEGDIENLELTGGSSVEDIINRADSSRISFNNTARTLTLIYYTNDPVLLKGFEFKSSKLSTSQSPSKFYVYDIEGGKNTRVLSVSGLDYSAKLTTHYANLGKLKHFKVVFYGRSAITALQYFKPF